MVCSPLSSWTGSRDSGPQQHFRLIGAVSSPVTNLKISVLDAFGQVVSQDDASVVSITSDPHISGLLSAPVKKGVATLPPIYMDVTQDTAASFSVNISVSSPGGLFSDLVRELTFDFCGNGLSFNPTTFGCDICPYGSW